MFTDDAHTHDAQAREARRARLHACALRAESCRLQELSRRRRKQFREVRLAALLQLARVRQAAPARGADRSPPADGSGQDFRL